MKEIEQERRDWMIVAVILLFGLFCVIFGGGWALRLSPSWKLDADMGSKLDPNSDYLTNRPIDFVEAIDPAILTQPVWLGFYLTPDADIPTRIRLTSTPTPLATSTRALPTATKFLTGTATKTLIYFPPTHTATSYPTNTKTPKPKAASTPTATATSTPITPTPSADLQITKTDNISYYEAGGSTTYTIVVSNNGPTDVSSATVTDNFPSQVSSATWTCVGTGGTCTASSSGNINDVVNLPAGSSVAYTVNASMGSASGDMINTATVSSSVTDPVLGNNTATDADQLAFPLPYGNIGTAPDGASQNIPTSSYLVIKSGTLLTIGSGQSLVYYLPPSLQIDSVILQIGDGNNWYTVFNWGDGSPDSNTNIPVPLSSPPNPTTCAGEPDNCGIDTSFLYNSTGFTIDLDLAGIPSGSYSYIRIISPSDSGDGVDVDAIGSLP